MVFVEEFNGRHKRSEERRWVTAADWIALQGSGASRITYPGRCPGL